MYYPFKKQLTKTFNLYKIDDLKTKYQTFFKQFFIILFKLFLMLIACVILFYAIYGVRLAFYIRDYLDNDLIISSGQDVIDQLNQMMYEIQNFSLDFNIDGGIFGSTYSIIGDFLQLLIEAFLKVILKILIPILNAVLGSLVQNVADALSLLNDPVEPISVDVLNNYLNARLIMYQTALTLDLIASIVDAIPWVDFGSGFSDLALQMWHVGDLIGQKYNDTIVPMVSTAEHMWNSIVMPFTSILNSSLALITSLTGLTLLIPILTHNENTLFHLPIYFWISYITSLIFVVGILSFQLVSVSGSSNQKKKQRMGKNIIGGIMMTVISIIFIPILFLSLIFISGLIIENIFNASNIFAISDANSLSNLFVSNSFINGASLFPPGISGNWLIPDYPTGYYNGQSIIITSTYFDYTFFIIFSTLTIIFLFIIIFWLIIKIFNLIQFMILGPITTSFFIKDGGLSFKSWLGEVLNLFAQLTIMSIQIAILIAISAVLNISLNEQLSLNPKISIFLVTFLIAAMTISMFILFTKLKNILFKDRAVKASISSEDFEGTKVDANVLNKSLEINSKNLSATIKKVSKNEQKIQNKNFALNKQIGKINDELFKEVKSMKDVQKVNSKMYDQIKNTKNGGRR